MSNFRRFINLVKKLNTDSENYILEYKLVFYSIFSFITNDIWLKKWFIYVIASLLLNSTTDAVKNLILNFTKVINNVFWKHNLDTNYYFAYFYNTMN